MPIPTVDLKVQIQPDGIPRPFMAALMRKASVPELIDVAHSIGLKITIVFEQPGASA